MVRLCYNAKDEVMTIDEHVKPNGKLLSNESKDRAVVNYVEVKNIY